MFIGHLAVAAVAEFEEGLNGIAAGVAGVSGEKQLEVAVGLIHQEIGVPVGAADSSDPSSYPVQAFLKFSDGSNRKVADEQLQPPVGTGRMFGPFQQVPGKSISQVNFRIGANKDPQATGFSYRISVQGCH